MVEEKKQTCRDNYVCRHIDERCNMIESEGGDNAPDFYPRYVMMFLQTFVSMMRMITIESNWNSVQILIMTIFFQHLLFMILLGIIAICRRHLVYIKGWLFVCKSFTVCSCITSLIIITSTIIFPNKWYDGENLFLSFGILLATSIVASIILCIYYRNPPITPETVLPA